jgi:hypothetical protein
MIADILARIRGDMELGKTGSQRPTCPQNAMGTSDAFTNSAECFCSARYFEDGDCPVRPPGA